MDHMPRVYAMALGAGETTPLRHTAAYAMLANGGKRITPTLIDRIQDRNGKTIFRADQRQCDGCGDDRLAEAAGAGDPRQPRADRRSGRRRSRSSTMMQGVVQRGTGTAVKAVGKPIAGKTGTTNDWQDAWFVGFTPDLAAGVYSRLRRAGQSRLERDRRPSRGADLPRFHDRGAEGRAGQGVPHARRACGMYRVSPATGLPAGAGEPAIWEGYKPGTEPGKDRDRGLQPVRRRADRRRRGPAVTPVRDTPARRHRRAVLRPRSSTRWPAAPRALRIPAKAGTHLPLSRRQMDPTLPDRIRH